jgi:hypothetical protein
MWWLYHSQFSFIFSLILVLICVVLAPNQYCVGYANPDVSYPPPVEGGGAYIDGYGRFLFIY